MKSAIHIALLSLWICALAVPSVVTLLNSDENPVFVMNLNEEEQQEQGKKNVEEKQIANNCSISLAVIAQLENSGATDFYLISASGRMTEIIIPPPEAVI